MPGRSCNGAQALPSWSVRGALGGWLFALVIVETSRGRDSPTCSFVATDSTSCLPASGRGWVKTLTKIFGQKIDRLERPTSDDRHLGNGFDTHNFSVSLVNFELLHRLGTLPNAMKGCSLAG
jgi:hypothetical protein